MIGQQMPASEATLRGFSNTRAYAAAAAERSGEAFRKGHPFTCVRGQGRLTLEDCLSRFLGGHEVCTRELGCSLGKRAVEKMNAGRIEMPKKFKKGDCACGKKDVQLDSEGRCYQCRDKARWAAQKAAKEAAEQARKPSTPPPAAPEAPKATYGAEDGAKAAQGHLAADDGQMVGPRVEEAGERLREAIPPEGQLVGDEDPAPGAADGWPETGDGLVIEGMTFEAFKPRLKAGDGPMMTLQSGKIFCFNRQAVKSFDLEQFRYAELHFSRAGGAVAMILRRQTAAASAMSIYIPRAKDCARVCAQGFLKAFGLDLKGKGPWPVEMPKPGVLVARVG